MCVCIYIWNYWNKPITTCNEYRQEEWQQKTGACSKVVMEGSLSHDQFGLIYYSPASTAAFQEGKCPNCPTSEFDVWSEKTEKASHRPRGRRTRDQTKIRPVEVACCAEDHPSREGYFLLAKQGAFSFLLYLFLERVSSNIELLILLNCRGYRHALSHLVYMFTSVLVTKPKAVVMVGINCTNWATFPSLSKAIL